MLWGEARYCPKDVRFRQMSMTPHISESSLLLEAPNGSPVHSCRQRPAVIPLGRAMLIGRPCLILECLREAMSVRGIETNASPFEQGSCTSDYDIFVIFLMRCELGALAPVKQRVSELRSHMPRIPSVALIEDPDATEAAACCGIGFSTVVLGLPSVPFAVDVVVNLLLLASHPAREFKQADDEAQNLRRRIEAESREPNFTIPDVCFTSRETELLDFLRHGMQNKRIAYELGISESTVKAHLRSIMMKLKAKNRTEAACMLAQESERTKEIIHG
jgi:DNA-binding NarL/FixJ family response regulator